MKTRNTLIKLTLLQSVIITVPGIILLYWYFEYGSKIPDDQKEIGYFILFFIFGFTLFLASKIQQKIEHIKRTEYYRPDLNE